MSCCDKVEGLPPEQARGRFGPLSQIEAKLSAPISQERSWRRQPGSRSTFDRRAATWLRPASTMTAIRARWPK